MTGQVGQQLASQGATPWAAVRALANRLWTVMSYCSYMQHLGRPHAAQTHTECAVWICCTYPAEYDQAPDEGYSSTIQHCTAEEEHDALCNIIAAAGRVYPLQANRFSPAAPSR